MQRYNQGFGVFGPMEKCNTGRWARADEAIEEIRTALGVAQEARTDANKWFDRRCEESDMVLDLTDENQKLKTALSRATSVATIFAVLTVADTLIRLGGML